MHAPDSSPVPGGPGAATAPALADAVATAPLAHFVVPWGRQEITLEELRFGAGGAPLLRVRIREARRFTIFDIDAVSAGRWAAAMARWSAHALTQAAATEAAQTAGQAAAERPHGP